MPKRIGSIFVSILLKNNFFCGAGNHQTGMIFITLDRRDLTFYKDYLTIY
jgi:hypothetical protein